MTSMINEKISILSHFAFSWNIVGNWKPSNFWFNVSTFSIILHYTTKEYIINYKQLLVLILIPSNHWSIKINIMKMVLKSFLNFVCSVEYFLVLTILIGFDVITHYFWFVTLILRFTITFLPNFWFRKLNGCIV